MLDTDATTTKPTGKAMRDKLKELVAGAKDKDVIVFHYSGHGTQVGGLAGVRQGWQCACSG